SHDSEARGAAPWAGPSLCQGVYRCLVLRSRRPPRATPPPSQAAAVLCALLRERNASEQRLNCSADLLLHHVTDHRQQALPSLRKSSGLVDARGGWLVGAKGGYIPFARPVFRPGELDRSRSTARPRRWSSPCARVLPALCHAHVTTQCTARAMPRRA